MFDRNTIKTYMTIENDFHGIRVVEGTLIPTLWSLTANVVGLEDPTLSDEENQVAITLAYQRVNFWLDSVLDRIVIADRNEDTTTKLYLCRLGNVIMHVPGDPSDDTIVQLLHSKLTTLAGANLLVGRIELKGTDTRSTYIFEPESEEDYTLPTLAEFVDGETIYDAPWWQRRDLDVHDMEMPKETTREELIEDLGTAHMVDAFDQEMMDQMFPDYAAEEETDEGPAWTPTIVE